MATNSNLVDQGTARALVDSLDYIYLSTDGIGELHDRLRGRPGAFERVVRALRCFQEAKAGHVRPLLVCNTTVSTHNVAHLSEIAAFAVEAGYDRVDFEYVGEFTPSIVRRSQIGEILPSPIFLQTGESSLIPRSAISTLRRQLLEAAQVVRSNRAMGKQVEVCTTSIDVLSDADLVNGTVPYRRCFMERIELVIDPYGNIVPCCFFDNYVVGNVRNGDLDRSWETPARGRFRAYRNAHRLAACEHCIHSVDRNCTLLDTIRRGYMEYVRHPVQGNCAQNRRR